MSPKVSALVMKRLYKNTKQPTNLLLHFTAPKTGKSYANRKSSKKFDVPLNVNILYVSRLLPNSLILLCDDFAITNLNKCINIKPIDKNSSKVRFCLFGTPFSG